MPVPALLEIRRLGRAPFLHEVEAGLLTEAAAYLARLHSRTVFTIDPPEHTRQRRVVARFFAPFKVVSWEAKVGEITLLDRCRALALASGNDFACDASYLLHGLRSLDVRVGPPARETVG